MSNELKLVDALELNLLEGTSYKKLIDLVEKVSLETLLLKNRFNQSKVATKMGISRGGLRIKMKKYFGNKYFRTGDTE